MKKHVKTKIDTFIDTFLFIYQQCLSFLFYFLSLNCMPEMIFFLNDILGFNQYMKSDKMPYIIYADVESLIKKNGCAKNPKNSTTKIGEHISCGYSM